MGGRAAGAKAERDQRKRHAENRNIELQQRSTRPHTGPAPPSKLCTSCAALSPSIASRRPDHTSRSAPASQSTPGVLPAPLARRSPRGFPLLTDTHTSSRTPTHGGHIASRSERANGGTRDRMRCECRIHLDVHVIVIMGGSELHPRYAIAARTDYMHNWLLAAFKRNTCITGS